MDAEKQQVDCALQEPAVNSKKLSWSRAGARKEAQCSVLVVVEAFAGEVNPGASYQCMSRVGRNRMWTCKNRVYNRIYRRYVTYRRLGEVQVVLSYPQGGSMDSSQREETAQPIYFS